MKKKRNPTVYLLFFLFLVGIAGIFFISYRTYQKINSFEKELLSISQQVTAQQEVLNQSKEIIDKAVQNARSKTESAENPSANAEADNSQANTAEPAPEEENTTEPASSSVFSDANDAVASSNGYIIGIDPGHQGWHVNMSDLEPNGPGSSEMKAKATTGTEGSYTGLAEFQLNLDVSLKLEQELLNRGYQVVLTRRDNDTAISNSERAQLVAQQGADIYVRIHANGDDSHTVSGALTMAPTSGNPYIPQLAAESERLSRCIIDSYCSATGFNNLGIQYTDTMTGINWSSVPVTILEMGFMSHEYDDTKMADSEFQNVMVQGIANGIDAYFGQQL